MHRGLYKLSIQKQKLLADTKINKKEQELFNLNQPTNQYIIHLHQFYPSNLFTSNHNHNQTKYPNKISPTNPNPNHHSTQTNPNQESLTLTKITSYTKSNVRKIKDKNNYGIKCRNRNNLLKIILSFFRERNNSLDRYKGNKDKHLRRV